MASREKVTSAFAPDLDEVRAWLQRMIAALRFVEMVTAVIALIVRMRDINTELVAQLAHLRRRHPRSETLDRLERQLVLPIEGLTVQSTAKPNDATTDNDKKRRRGHHPGRGAPPAHLPRVPVFNRVPPELRICPQCGTTMTTVSHSSCLVLNVIPARVFVEERLDETVACPNDDTIVSASPPPQIVERGKLADTLIVEAVCDKYIEHLPVERQCARFSRAGVEIAPQTLGRSVSAALDLLAPVARLIQEQTRGPGLLGTDATGIPVLDPGAPEGIRNGNFLLFAGRRRREREALSGPRPRAHGAVRWHEHHDIPRAHRRQAPRLLCSRAATSRRSRPRRRSRRPRRRADHRAPVRGRSRLDVLG
jgi:transposase